jgi:putative ABC transport system permease protein
VSAWFTGLVGATVEAWAELRIHRTRVLLSLIGVAVAVAALTTVVALGQIAEQALTESSERQGGRPALLSIYISGSDGNALPQEKTDAAFAAATERFRVKYSSHSASVNARVQFADGVEDVQTEAVDVSYGTMHRMQVMDGRWFTTEDERLLAPAVIVNENYWKRLGSPPLTSHPKTTLVGENNVTAVIVGVMGSSEFDPSLSMIILYPSYARVTPPAVQNSQPPSYEMWVPPELAQQLIPLVKSEFVSLLGTSATVEVNRQDYLAYQIGDPLATVKLVVIGGALLVLLLGALGLVNISLVTVRQRIREIGIRRSFGATAGRVFFAVMMESIVATVAAGAVGVVAAILLVQSPFVQNLVGSGVIDLPPFPVEAAVVGIVAATVVGALAGLLPALIAVRVKVIDAIRY